MTTGFPIAVGARPPPQRARLLLLAPKPHAAPQTSAVRYPVGRNSRAVIASAILVSAALHAGLLLGIGPRQKVASRGIEEKIVAIRLAIPELKDLEEPEVAPFDTEGPPLDPGTLVPMQADVPQLPRPNDFVQQLNFASLVEQPDFSKLNVYVIPENIRASGSKLAEQFGRIFNLTDLDRAPEPVLQPAPVFPIAMRRDAQSATVSVEFIVDVNGRVLDPVVTESTNYGFNDAALAGVSRWKFRAGMKGGRKVNTRMRVPIVFKLLDAIDS